MDPHRLTKAILDLQEGRWPVPLLDDVGMADVLRRARRIAVVGASPRPGRPSLGVFDFLRRVGYDVVPVNPRAEDVHGVMAYPDLASATAAGGPFDIVDVFRRPEACPGHAREAVEAGAACLWLQLGVVDWDAARIAHAGGLSVVMDRCTAIEYPRLLGAPAT